MSAINLPHSKDASKSSFWKKSSKSVPGSLKPVYGAQYPPRQEPGPPSLPTSPKKEQGGFNAAYHSNPIGGPPGFRKEDSFQNFQLKTQDAWEIGDDEDVTMAPVNPKVVQSTALQVLNNHSLQQARAKHNNTEERSNSPKSTALTNSPPPHPPTKNNGPGMGVRVNHWHVPKISPLQLGPLPVLDRESSKLEKFKTVLNSTALNLDELKKISWSGIPHQCRPTTWKILSGYLPTNLDRRKMTLERKRQEYYSFIDQYFDTRHQDLHKETFRQIAIDIPRMSPLIPVFKQPLVQQIFERILFIWAIRHPASGYVQGINDLVTPFFVVFLMEHIGNDINIENYELSQLPRETVQSLEADSFWCFSKLLDGIQDNYTFAQPGIQNKVHDLKELVSRIDKNLHQHLAANNVEYLQFAFRWMNNLLMREVPLRCIIRLWDTCLSEPDGFSSFYLYVSAAFLLRFSQDVQREHDFQGILLMLQNLTTHHWTNEEIGLLLAEAYKLKFMFADAPRHLTAKS